jgi:hypothetical protein
MGETGMSDLVMEGSNRDQCSWGLGMTITGHAPDTPS